VPERFGSYLVHEELGIGGMASVHVAEEVATGRRVALKRLLAHKATEPETVRAFLDEARLVVRLKHPNIAETYECGEVDGTYFIAMEYVPGHTLAQLIRQCEKTLGVIPFAISVNILMQLCEALQYAHTLADDGGKPLNIIHRDISPANVILSSKGIVKLIDFGIAKATTATVHSHAGVVKGKFRYMAPEYLKGKLDSRCDLWAMGTVAYELLTNKHLFDGSDDFNIMYNVRFQEIKPPSTSNPDVPPDFDVIVMTALQREPDQRWQSAGAMGTALSNASTELQTVVTNAQLIEWVEWTFSQGAPAKELSQLIEILKQPTKTRARISQADIQIVTEPTPSPTSIGSDAVPAAEIKREPTPATKVNPVPKTTPETKAADSTPTPKPVIKTRRRTSPGMTSSSSGSNSDLSDPSSAAYKAASDALMRKSSPSLTPSKPLGSKPVDVASIKKLGKRRSRWRPWLLCFLLVSLAFAIWRLGYMPPEIDELIARIRSEM
jgi:eukaryotic-like serine/threonine-protein kinase